MSKRAIDCLVVGWSPGSKICREEPPAAGQRLLMYQQSQHPWVQVADWYYTARCALPTWNWSGQVTEVASQMCLPPSGFTGNPVKKFFPHFSSQLEFGHLGEHLWPNCWGEEHQDLCCELFKLLWTVVEIAHSTGSCPRSSQRRQQQAECLHAASSCDVFAHHLTSRQVICGPVVTPLHVLSLMTRWLLARVACL